MYDDNVALQGPLPYSSRRVLHNPTQIWGGGLGRLGRLAMGGWGGVRGDVCADEGRSSPWLLNGVHMGRFNKGPR